MRVIHMETKSIDGDIHYQSDTGCSFGSCVFTEQQSPHLNQCDNLDLVLINERLEWVCNKPTCLSACDE